jgi:hypothetical protein
MTKKNLTWLLALPVALAGIAVLSQGRAADHLDSPGAKHDPAGDIADVYAFMSPNAAALNHAVLVQTVFPVAGSTSKFSDKIDYVFKVRQVTNPSPLTLDPTPLDIKCNFTNGTPQTVTCTAPGGIAAKTVTVGDVGTCGAADDICVYAGLRSDPFFFDLQAFKDSVAANASKFKAADAGAVNFFQGLNALALVVEVDATKAFAAGAIITVAAETKRTAL